jgi:hypothetical protein
MTNAPSRKFCRLEEGQSSQREMLAYVRPSVDGFQPQVFEGFVLTTHVLAGAKYRDAINRSRWPIGHRELQTRRCSRSACHPCDSDHRESGAKTCKQRFGLPAGTAHANNSRSRLSRVQVSRAWPVTSQYFLEVTVSSPDLDLLTVNPTWFFSGTNSSISRSPQPAAASLLSANVVIGGAQSIITSSNPSAWSFVAGEASTCRGKKTYSHCNTEAIEYTLQSSHHRIPPQLSVFALRNT